MPSKKKPKVKVAVAARLESSSEEEEDNSSSTDEEYEVEHIADSRLTKDGKQEFLIKWRGWHKSENSWVPVEDVKCEDLLKRYRKKRTEGDLVDLPRIFTHRQVEIIRQSGVNKFVLIARPTSRVLNAIEKQKRSLKTWEKEINEFLHRLNKGIGRVVVENTVDLDGAPNGFTYVGDYRNFITTDVQFQFLSGCNCGPAGCFASSKNCCPRLWKADFAYSKETGRLRLGPRQAIYECNAKCSCDDSCLNRVVQKGTNLDLVIFKTDDGRGWGVKTPRRLKPGTFVVEYLGEIIRTKDVHERTERYTKEGLGSNYLMELDFSSESGIYTIDASRYGNVSRFINHSCSPNLDMQTVFINNVDRDMPRIAFFANREIASGEELSFDYGSIQIENNDEDKPKCYCKSANCRGYLFGSND